MWFNGATSPSSICDMWKVLFESLLNSVNSNENMKHVNLHVNPERSFGGTNGEPPSEARQLRKGGPGVLPLKISKTYIANGAIYVIPELYL